MSQVIIAKLGGSLITDKARSRTVRRRDLARIADEIAAAMRRSRRRLILGHGSGSFGHVAAARHGVHEGLRHRRQLAGVSATQGAAGELHRIVVEALRGAGLRPFSIVPSSCIVCRNRVPVSVAVEPLVRALDAGLLPVTYGDVVMDRARGVAIASTETVLLALARRLLARGDQRIVRALWFGDTTGVYDAGGSTLKRLGPADRKRLAGVVSGSAATDVTGGMQHRLDTAERFARLGIPSLIASGRQPGLVGEALRGRRVAGTSVVPE